MYCPRCGESQAAGSQRCTACGHPFTRRQTAQRPSMSRGTTAVAPRTRQFERHGGSGRRALTALAGVILLGILLVAGIAALSSPSVRSSVGDTINGRLGGGDPPTAGQPAAAAPVAPSPTAEPEEGARQLVLTPDDMMDFVDDYRDDIQPLSVKGVEITDDAVLVHISAYGLSGTYQTQIVARDGDVVLEGGRVSGLLGMAVPVDTLQSRLNQELQSAVSRNNARIDAVTLAPGQVTVTYEKPVA